MDRASDNAAGGATSPTVFGTPSTASAPKPRAQLSRPRESEPFDKLFYAIIQSGSAETAVINGTGADDDLFYALHRVADAERGAIDAQGRGPQLVPWWHDRSYTQSELREIMMKEHGQPGVPLEDGLFLVRDSSQTATEHTQGVLSFIKHGQIMNLHIKRSLGRYYLSGIKGEEFDSIEAMIQHYRSNNSPNLKLGKYCRSPHVTLLLEGVSQEMSSSDGSADADGKKSPQLSNGQEEQVVNACMSRLLWSSKADGSAVVDGAFELSNGQITALERVVQRRGYMFKLLWSTKGTLLHVFMYMTIFSSIYVVWIFQNINDPDGGGKIYKANKAWSIAGNLAEALAFLLVFWMAASLKWYQHVIVPKTSDELINGLFSGAPVGTVMCSYSRRQHDTEKADATLGYKEKHMLLAGPRYAASWHGLAAGVCQGGAQLHMCVFAPRACLYMLVFACARICRSRSARFSTAVAFVFVSKGYLMSPICLTEFLNLTHDLEVSKDA